MNVNELNRAKLRALDYVLNYDPDTRIKYTIDEDLVEELVDMGVIEKREEKDNYSNYYTVLEIKNDYEGDIKTEIRSNFEELYPEPDREVVTDIFQDHVGDMFSFYNKARSTDRESVRAARQISPSLFNDLEQAGFGFRRQYLTTSDNIHQQFIFRSFPFNGKERLIELAQSVIKTHLKGLTQTEKWAIYVKAAVGEDYISTNPANFSPERIEEIKETPTVKETSEEVLEFIREDIKDFLRARIYRFLEEDPFYFSVLEFLKIQSGSDGAINSELLENIEDEQKDSVSSMLSQLAKEGVLLQRGEDGFTMTVQVKEILEIIEKRSVVVSYPIRTPKEGQEILYEILEDVEDEVKIIDQYFDDSALDLIRSVVPKKENLQIHILTAVGSDRRENLLEEYRDLVDSSRYEIRIIQGDQTPHDRFIIADGEKIWQVGHSINGLGDDFSTIFLHSEEESHHYRELFDSLWEEAKTPPETKN